MIRAAARYFAQIPPVFIDGLLFVLIAWFIFNQSYLGGDEAAKYIEPKMKFWLNWGMGSVASMCGALKMFRSSAYADHQHEKKNNKTRETEFITSELPKP